MFVRFPLPSRLDNHEKLVREVYTVFRSSSADRTSDLFAAEWLLDNIYIVERAIAQIRHDMPRKYFRQLALLCPDSTSEPPVLHLAREIVMETACLLDIDQITNLVERHQSQTVLTMGELWALPTMLRLAVVEELCAALRELTASETWTEAETGPQGDRGPKETVVANSIMSLRMLANEDWKSFFEGASAVEKILQTDPNGWYSRMDFKTRDDYRKSVERLAMSAGCVETDVALAAVQLADSACRSTLGNSRTQHVGYFLVDRGRRQLEKQLGSRSMRAWFTNCLLGCRLGIYLGGIGLLTIILVTLIVTFAALHSGGILPLIATATLTFVPAAVIAGNIINHLATHFVAPRTLPKLDCVEGIPEECRTIVVMPSMLTSRREVGTLLRQIEQHFIGNNDPLLGFALLTDFPDAPHERMDTDDDLLAQVESGIRCLNHKYGSSPTPPFSLFHRRRQWNEAEKIWMGWERKRGKLEEFDRLLRGKETSFEVQIGDLGTLPKIRYVITLDADTNLPRNGARSLIGALAHPLNQAEFDPESGCVAAGYTVLQPRVQVDPMTAGRSLFSRIFTRDIGFDLYTCAVSDVYQDLFGEGNYVGKGIYDVDAFERSMADRVEENTILSHDLFEGIHGRAALVSDIVLFEDYPPNYLAYVRRMHRWVRGDWQLVPWLWRKVPHESGEKVRNRLSILSQWKILDNLLRSLLTPALCVLAIAGWLVLPGPALAWTVVVLAPLSLPALSGGLAGLRRRLKDKRLRQSAAIEATRTERADILRSILAVIFLPYEAIVSIHAIAVTLVRLTFTRKHLLQWTTAATTADLTNHQMKNGSAVWRKMSSAPFFSIAATIGIIVINPASLPAACPLLVLWFFSPMVADVIGRSIFRRSEPLPEQERRRLRLLARRTWLFFEQFIGPEDHWLPPDHFQEDPRGLVAHRTSPTNIGLLLLSTLSAHDLGFVGPLETALRLGGTFEGLGGLEMHRNHFLNWYDTRTLDPLSPRYVSVVDSGNLAASLLVLKEGCREMPDSILLRRERWMGMVDILSILEGTLRGTRLGKQATPFGDRLTDLRGWIEGSLDNPERWPALLDEILQDELPELERTLVSFVEDSTERLGAPDLHALHLWFARLRHHVADFRREVQSLHPWISVVNEAPDWLEQATTRNSTVSNAWRALVDTFNPQPSLGNVAAACEKAGMRLEELQKQIKGPRRGNLPPRYDRSEAEKWCSDLKEALDSGKSEVERLLAEYRRIGSAAETLFDAMDFTFLFDKRRQVFHIGYNVDNRKLDDNHYDLLASEARLASLLAIAKGEVPLSHWVHLARPLTRLHGRRVLLSWSGTMFEYLMPLLWTGNPEETLLGDSCYWAVRHQIEYGRLNSVPWGFSESGYFVFDASMNYQYRAFGVPRLGFKRGLRDDLVVSPYASVLALNLSPKAVVANLDRLFKLEMCGLYGLYEAVDFTRSRLGGRDHEIVRSYMAHHQGMILLAVCNNLCTDAMVRRFHANRWVRSSGLLLYEQTPLESRIEYPRPQERREHAPREIDRVALEPWRPQSDLPSTQVHVLSNGRYRLLITASGACFSRWRGLNLTRWRDDSALQDLGTWIYVRDLESGDLWSSSPQPMCSNPQSHEVLFKPHKVEFQRHEHDISVRQEIVVAANEDVEIRRITVTNETNRIRRISLTSYAEVALASPEADLRHPTFSKLFVDTEHLPELSALLLKRRPRSHTDQAVFVVHMVTSEDPSIQPIRHESDRAVFLGRGGTPRSPAALKRGGKLTGTTGPVLDPIMSLEFESELKPHDTIVVCFMTLVAPSRKKALSLADDFLKWPRIKRAFGEVRVKAVQELSRLNFKATEIATFQRLLSAVLFAQPTYRAPPSILEKNRRGQQSLWPFGISGDEPIVLVTIADDDEIGLLDDVLGAHAYWRENQIMVDLVILSREETSYDPRLTGEIHSHIHRFGGEVWLNRRGGIYVLVADQICEEDRILLQTSARVNLEGRSGRLVDQLSRLHDQPVMLPRLVPTQALSPRFEPDQPPQPQLDRPNDLLFDNSYGGFKPDGNEYVVFLEPGHWTPAPWVNVIANAHFGFLVSEAGSGYSWAENSGENRLTSWHNDPVSDPPGEAIYIRDETSGEIWSPTPLPCRADRSPYLIRHGIGYSVFEHISHGLSHWLRLFTVPDQPLKVVQLRIRNTMSQTRRVTVTYYAEWVLGVSREMTKGYLIPEFDSNHFSLLASNPFNDEFGERISFLAATREVSGVTSDRTEFLGHLGSYTDPAALSRTGLTARVEAGPDQCAVIQSMLWLAPGEEKEISFLLGQGSDRAGSLGLVREFQNIGRIERAFADLTAFWKPILNGVTVRTPDAAMDLLLNRWLLYQLLSCRLWGRSALYQSSGAFGFRDQLQDVMALNHVRPDLIRQHIIDAAGRQFVEGDVLHWWHPPSGRGVRTKCSDDLLWLPYVTSQYVTATGDRSILDEKTCFLGGPPLGKDEHENYGLYQHVGKEETITEHCWRALDRGTTAGSHGLPLIGSHDWNDGFNRIGIEGQGESVWLGWFLYSTLQQFATVMEAVGASHRASELRSRSSDLRDALANETWDGAWFLRAYFDDGMPLGSSANDECQIDSIAQSWAVLSGAADPMRAERAMTSVGDRLVRREDGVVVLFTPPFDRSLRDPGYIKGYLPGIRENGGQYTHAALWAIWAFASLGNGDFAEELYRMINPIYHTDSRAGVERYKVEPYVVAADVYSEPPHVGRGGWTWYTGSASWMYRVGLEAILGIRREGHNLRIDPCIPKSWGHFEVDYQFSDTSYHIAVDNPQQVCRGVDHVLIDDQPVADAIFRLVNDGGHHEVSVRMGAESGGPEDHF